MYKTLVDLWGIEPATFLKLTQDLAGTAAAKMYCRHLLFPDFRNNFPPKCRKSAIKGPVDLGCCRPAKIDFQKIK